MVWYCEEVAEARRALASVGWDSVVPLLVAASAIRSRWPSRAWSAKLLTWVNGPNAAWNASASGEVWTSGCSVASVMPWSAVAAEALPKTLPPLSGGPLITLERELVGTESGFPSRPGLVCAWETIPVRVLFRKTAGGKEGAGGYGC